MDDVRVEYDTTEMETPDSSWHGADQQAWLKYATGEMERLGEAVSTRIQRLVSDGRLTPGQGALLLELRREIRAVCRWPRWLQWLRRWLRGPVRP